MGDQGGRIDLRVIWQDMSGEYNTEPTIVMKRQLGTIGGRTTEEET